MDRSRATDRAPDDEAGIHHLERIRDDEVAAMQRESDRVERDIEATRKEWEALREDPSVPGARPREDSPPDDAAEEAAGDWSGTAEAAKEAGQD
ncbi:hypothetical protein [Conexibacter arvalis]|uniref:Uncharacterized protein n=1 Tax=Conexibacter arvalis TaxID=912552 RepID=A0A840IKA5_9ACTN|nr:hypothetical protein [Conexibacter arvalis]MBB4664360.1 hypothetical protein [Conexibacter arvalis]